MLNIKFNSLLSEQIQEFINFKYDFGHDYGTQTYHLKSFDDYGYVLKEKVNYAELVNKVMTYSSLICCEPSHIQVFY